MARPTSRRSLRFDSLEDRQLLSSGGPSSQQQYMLQLINMVRSTPKEAAEWVGNSVTRELQYTLDHYRVDLEAVKRTIASNNPLPPVAWNDKLGDAAQKHSQDMANNRFQSHKGSDGSSPEGRIKASGFQAKSSAENAFAYANGVENAHQAFTIDWGVEDQGHLKTLLQQGVSAEESFSDVGIGIVKTEGKAEGQVGPVVVTQNFARDENAQAKLVGVVYSDDDGSKFYTPGEGQGGVQIDATNVETGQTQSTKTWDSGGYQLALAPGRYRVAASRNNTLIRETMINMGTVNVAQDFDLSQRWDGRKLNSGASAKAETKSEPKTEIKAEPKAETVQENDKAAAKTDADWKSISAAVAKSVAKFSGGNAKFRSPLADWTTWKANSQ